MRGWFRHKSAILLGLAIFGLVLAGGVWRIGFGQTMDQLAQRGEADLALASDRLTAQLKRYQEVAVLLADHPDLQALATGAASHDANRARALLQEVADKTAALDLIYADASGRVLAAVQGNVPSPSQLRTTPHFQRALHGALGADHGVSDRFERRVFYFAAPAFDADGRVQAVLSVVVDVEDVETTWRGDRPTIVFVDTREQIFISNRSELVLAQRLEGGSALRLANGTHMPIERRMRAGQEVWHMDWGPYVPKRVMHLRQPLPVIGMTGEAVIDIAPALRIAWLQAGMVVLITLAFGLFLFQAIQRRQVLAEANTVLEDRVTARTRALSEANNSLRREVAERQEAEAALKRAQAELVQAGKLSALGQMSAGISHELNQPLQAIQQFAENGETFLARGKPDAAAGNLARISGLADRMARIIRNLRAFARNEKEPLSRVDVVSVMAQALELTEARLRHDGIALDWKAPKGAIWARAGEVRLAQVIVNLINNAADAMEGQDTPRIRITVSGGPDGCQPRIEVVDTGPGIQEPERIFDPFYSTKAVGAGDGLGLGLSISYGIVQSFGGNIRGANAPDGVGAVFSVALEPWPEQERTEVRA